MEDVFKDQFFGGGTEGWAFNETRESGKPEPGPSWDHDPWAGGDAFFTAKSNPIQPESSTFDIF